MAAHVLAPRVEQHMSKDEMEYGERQRETLVENTVYYRESEQHMS